MLVFVTDFHWFLKILFLIIVNNAHRHVFCFASLYSADRPV